MRQYKPEVYIHDADKYAPACDSCGRQISKTESYLSGIDSCCGGCLRSMCFECTLAAAKLVEEHRGDDHDH